MKYQYLFMIHRLTSYILSAHFNSHKHADFLISIPDIFTFFINYSFNFTMMKDKLQIQRIKIL